MDIQPDLSFVIKQELGFNDVEYNINNNYHPDFKVDVKIESEDDDKDWCIKSDEETLQYKTGKEENSLDVGKICSLDTKNLIKNEPSLNSIKSGFDTKNFNATGNQGDGKGSGITGNKMSLEGDNVVQCLSDSDSEDDLPINLEEKLNKGLETVVCENITLTYQCQDCTVTFEKDENLLEHIRAIHGSNKNTNTVINLDSDDETISQKVDKIRTQALQKQYKCSECKQIFAFTSSDAINGDNKCKRCSTKSQSTQENSSDSEGLLIRFDKRPKKYRMHTCKICSKTFKYKHWHAHMRQVHGPGSYACEPCKMEFKCARYLKRHIMFQHEGVPRSYEKNKPQDGKVKCSQCPKSFKNSDNLTHHIQNCHGEPVDCDICHCTVKSKSYLLTHKRRRHGNGKQQFSCPVCPKGLKSLEALQVHVRKCHSDKKEKCKYCKKEFKCKQYYRAHTRRCLKNPERAGQSDKSENEEFVNVVT